MMKSGADAGLLPEAIYHEKQFGSLCGQHCCNNLLQGPYWTAAGLGEIASDLDDAERALLGNHVADFKSHNVDDSGNFSIQVLRQALQQSHGISLVGGDGVSLGESSFDSEQAFVLNLHAHWYVIRRIEGEFWTINSMRPKPERISAFYLNAYLTQLRNEGWYIFCVRGELPTPMKFDGGQGTIFENWYFPRTDIEEVAKGVPGDFVPFSGTGRRLVEEATPPAFPPGTAFDDDPELKAALEMSMRDQQNAGMIGTFGAPIALDDDDDGDADLAKAIAMSLEGNSSSAQPQSPPQPPPHVELEPEPENVAEDCATIQVVLKSGRRVRRRFACESLCDQIFLFAKESGEDLGKEHFALVSPGTLNERLLWGSGKTLRDVGLISSSNLRVQSIV